MAVVSGCGEACGPAVRVSSWWPGSTVVSTRPGSAGPVGSWSNGASASRTWLAGTATSPAGCSGSGASMSSGDSSVGSGSSSVGWAAGADDAAAAASSRSRRLRSAASARCCSPRRSAWATAA